VTLPPLEPITPPPPSIDRQTNQPTDSPTDPPTNQPLHTHKQVRAAIGRHLGCRLLLVEAVISEQLATTASARINGDVHMMIQYGDAKERTEVQFEELLGAAGFRMEGVLPTKGLFFVVEAVPL